MKRPYTTRKKHEVLLELLNYKQHEKTRNGKLIAVKDDGSEMSAGTGWVLYNEITDKVLTGYDPGFIDKRGYDFLKIKILGNQVVESQTRKSTGTLKLKSSVTIKTDGYKSAGKVIAVKGKKTFEKVNPVGAYRLKQDTKTYQAILLYFVLLGEKDTFLQSAYARHMKEEHPELYLSFYEFNRKVRRRSQQDNLSEQEKIKQGYSLAEDLPYLFALYITDQQKALYAVNDAFNSIGGDAPGSPSPVEFMQAAAMFIDSLEWHCNTYLSGKTTQDGFQTWSINATTRQKDAPSCSHFSHLITAIDSRNGLLSTGSGACSYGH